MGSFAGASPAAGQAFRTPPPSPPPQRRPRINQPLGFIVAGGLRPSYYYGKRHDYVYYPTSWTDTVSDTTYQEGYYDENGQYYKSVSFPKNGTYENVVCRCPYCGRETILNLKAEDLPRRDLECQYCGGPMEIQSELDDYISQGTAQTSGENTHIYVSAESLRKAPRKPKKRRSGCLISMIVLLCFVVLLAVIGATAGENSAQQTAPVGQYGYSGQDQQGGNSQLWSPGDPADAFGETISLARIGKNSYSITDSNTADKLLIWDADADSYCDPDTGYWLWYNENEQPAAWQYWIEGISSDYGDYGWMEHDETGWYIEVSNREWTALPGRYDTSELWYLAD